MIIKTRIEYFKEFLNYFWLRPENALMQTLRAEKLNKIYLKKSNQLDFFKQLVHHDNNKKMPFTDGEYDFTFTNSAYWVKNFATHINDLIRVTKPGKIIVLEMKLRDELVKYRAENFANKIMGNTFSKVTDAGRWATWRGLPTRKQLMKIIKANQKCEIEDMQPIYGGMVAKLYDIGFRPLSKPLTIMAIA